MITFKKFISESKEDLGSISPSAIAELLKKDCSQFFNDVRNPETDIITRNIRESAIAVRYDTIKGRSPKDTPRVIHHFIDSWFENKFGVRYRSDATFATRTNNGYYGKWFAIFPIGNYTACYSDKVQDLTDHIDKSFKGTAMDTIEDAGEMYYYAIKRNDSEQITKFENHLTDVMDTAMYKQSSIMDYIGSGGKINNTEIMINCDSYYAFSYETSYQRELLQSALSLI